MPKATPTLAQITARTGDDSVLPFQLDALDVRGRFARLDSSIDKILRLHDYPAPVSGLLAEAMLLTTLIGQTMKLEDRFSIQVRGAGPVRLVATDYFAPQNDDEPAQIRGYAGYDRDADLPSAGGLSLLGEGVMGVTIDHGHGQPYQGITPLVGDSLAECAEVYFAQSEQIATRFALTAGQAAAPGEEEQWRAGGIVIQHMPKASPLRQLPDGQVSGEAAQLMTADAVAEMSGESENWRTASLKLATVDPHELVGPHLEPEALLLRLFHEDTPRVYIPQAVTFGCTCSRDKLESFLVGHPKDALDEMAQSGTISGDCQFCGREYRFEIEKLLAAQREQTKGELK